MYIYICIYICIYIYVCMYVDDKYVAILQRLYEGQMAHVSVEVTSRQFPLKRGVKQGDPISGLLFIAVMEVCFRELKSKWAKLNERRSGPYIGLVIDNEHDVLSNLRFADDVLLVAQSLADARKMVGHLAETASKYGLKLNRAKTKILAMTRRRLPDAVDIGGGSIEIVSQDGQERYLGRNVCLGNFHEAELKSRLRGAWAAFCKYKAVFLSRAYSFASKAKLFDATVSPVLLYACACWTLTAGMEQQLTTTRRRMLRSMLGARRLPGEEWVEFIKRSTATAESKMAELGYTTWASAYRRRKWRFVARTAQPVDNRWSTRLLDWSPHFRCHPYRSVGRPLTRWQDCLVKMAGGDWQEVARTDVWVVLEGGFSDDLA